MKFKKFFSLTDSHKAQAAEKHANYFTYGVGVTECELDVLTGEQEIRRLDATLDFGERSGQNNSFWKVHAYILRNE